MGSRADSPGLLFPEANFDAVVLGSSVGGLKVLEELLCGLPRGHFPAPIVVVQHIGASSVSYLPTILARCTSLRVKHVDDGERLRAGTVYVAPPDRHVRIAARGRLALSCDARVHFTRPAADPLFFSAAEVLGPRALGVVLTGHMIDGARGAIAMRALGGLIIAQDPATCAAPGMPLAAIRTGAVNFILPPDRIGAALTALVATPGLPAALGLVTARRVAA